MRRHWEQTGTDIRKRQRRLEFTLIELMVVVAVIALLTAMLLPSLRLAKDKAKQSNCLSNQHQVGLAILMYASDYQEWTPCAWNGISTWFALLWSNAYLKPCAAGDLSIISCPSWPGYGKYTGSQAAYGLRGLHNDFGRHMRIFGGAVVDNLEGLNFGAPSVCPMLGDSTFEFSIAKTQSYFFDPEYTYPTAQRSLHFRHFNKANCLFADGHVAICDPGDLKGAPRMNYYRDMAGVEHHF